MMMRKRMMKVIGEEGTGEMKMLCETTRIKKKTEKNINRTCVFVSEVRKRETETL